MGGDAGEEPSEGSGADQGAAAIISRAVASRGATEANGKPTATAVAASGTGDGRSVSAADEIRACGWRNPCLWLANLVPAAGAQGLRLAIRFLSFRLQLKAAARPSTGSGPGMGTGLDSTSRPEIMVLAEDSFSGLMDC